MGRLPAPAQVALILDSGALYAVCDADDRHHQSILGALSRNRPPFVVSSAILGETDYLLVEFLGVGAQLKFLDALRSGYYSPEPVTARDLAYCRRVSPSGGRHSSCCRPDRASKSRAFRLIS